MSTDKRKIQVGLLPEQTEDYSQYEESEFNWGRIIFAAILMLAAVFVLLYTLLNPDEAPINKLATAEHTTLLPNNSSIAVPSTKEQTATSSVAKLTPQTSLVKPVKVTEANTPQADATPKVKQTAKEEKTPLIEKITTTTPVGPKPAPKMQQNKAVIQQKHANTHPIKTVSPVKIVDAHIKKAQLSSNLIKGLPVDTLSSRIIMSNEGIIRLHLYTEMENLRGKNLYHHWYRNGEKQARVRVPVNHDNQRSSSSKFINKQMLGKWAVQVLDEQGKAYIEVNFEVVKP